MATATQGSGVAAGRPQPQTTNESAGGPFVRYAQPGRRSQYVASGVAWGGLVNQPLVAAPGYTRGYRLNIAASGGTATTASITADGPGNVASLVQLKDAFGTPLIVAPGFHALQLIQQFGGQFGLDGVGNVLNLPSFTALSTTTGNFSFGTYLPLEFAKAYGVISSANASLLPTLQINVNSAAGFYGTSAPATAATLAFTVDQDFYWLPDGVAVEPPGLGTTEQWIYTPANPTIGSAASLNVQLPRLGGYLSTIIAELRGANGVRPASTAATAAGWPINGRWRFIVDGVPLIDTLDITHLEDMAIQFGVGMGLSGSNVTASATIQNSDRLVSGTASDVGTYLGGVRAITRKTGLSQKSMGLFDTGETYLSTNPGTQIEFAAAPWGGLAAVAAPATLNALCGQVVPSGAMIQGLPEV